MGTSTGLRVRRTIELLRHHRLEQILRRAAKVAQDRVFSRLPRRYRAKATESAMLEEAKPLLAELGYRRVGLWPGRNASQRLESMVSGNFSFLNQTCALTNSGLAQLTWNPNQNRLWRFHLQSQEYLIHLVGGGFEDAAWQIIQSWIECAEHQTPYLDDNAWHPFCISRRLPIWLMVTAISPAPKEALADRFWNSVAQQTQWLADHLELDLGGNHLLENLHALLMVTSFCSGDWTIDPAKLLERFEKQCQEQILDSGEHFERTPTYHAVMLLALEETLKAIDFSGGDTQPTKARRSRMQSFLGGILHPDGQIPLFGDSVLDETPDPRQLLADSERQSNLTSGDYWTWRSQAGDFLICDIGPIACDYLPAHGHADLFTVEASYQGRRILVDTGTFDYEPTEFRQHTRSTHAHNTAVIDGESQADTWSSFRMGRRGHPVWTDRGTDGKFDWLVGCHDAYAHLGVKRCGRLIAAADGPVWLIVDWFVGSGEHEITSRFHLHPDMEIANSGESHIQLTFKHDQSSQFSVQSVGEAKIAEETGWHCPNFGIKLPIHVLEQNCRSRDQGYVAWVLGADPPHAEIELSQTSLSIQIDDQPFHYSLRSS